MDTKALLEKLTQNGIPILEHIKRPTIGEEEIRLTERFSIQVLLDDPGRYCLTYEEGEDTLAVEPIRYTVKEILADAKKHVKTTDQHAQRRNHQNHAPMAT